MMLKFKNRYLSIEKFKETEIPDFTVLTGVNGAGKTHLLEAIQRKDVVIEGFEDANIIYFNYLNFYLENESIFNAQNISQERNNAWDFYKQQIQGNIQSWRNQLENSINTYSEVKRLCSERNVSIWDLKKTDFSNENQYVHYRNYRQAIQNLLTQNNIKNDPRSHGIFILIKSLPYSADELGESEFKELYKPFNLKNDFLPVHLGRIFWDYFMRLRENEFREFENREKGKKYKVYSMEDFIKKYGEKPWEIVSEILTKFNTLEFKINSPENYGYLDNYQLRLKHITKEIQLDFSNLSSGERILIALVATIYKLGTDAHFPEILLLDEIDASLHPSMIQNLLDVINEIFIKKGTKVILVSHSPTTVALASEKAIYLMNKSGEDRIVKRAKTDALNILTEGFATLEEGIKLFDQISKKEFSIITEGKNTEYIKKAIFYLFNDYFDKIDVISGAENKSGKDQLKVLFDFFKTIPHDKKVLFVWDCDVTFNLEETPKTFKFIFQKNSLNSKVVSGVENLFAEELFTHEFYKTLPKADGGTHTDLDKEKFKNHIIQNGTKDNFQNFQPLIEKLKVILQS